MTESIILKLFLVLAFMAGAALKSLSLVFNYDISATMIGFISLFSLVSLTLIFYLISIKNYPGPIKK